MATPTPAKELWCEKPRRRKPAPLRKKPASASHATRLKPTVTLTLSSAPPPAFSSVAQTRKSAGAVVDQSATSAGSASGARTTTVPPPRAGGAAGGVVAVATSAPAASKTSKRTAADAAAPKFSNSADADAVVDPAGSSAGTKTPRSTKASAPTRTSWTGLVSPPPAYQCSLP